jgi:hypothetical protein
MYYLPSILLPQRINSIRSLLFEWSPESSMLSRPVGLQPDYPADVQEEDQVQRGRWTTTWHVIASMQSLQDLHVNLYRNFHSWGSSLNVESAKILVQPITEVTGPERFTLNLCFPAKNGRKPCLMYSWSAAEGWQGGVDPWKSYHVQFEE